MDKGVVYLIGAGPGDPKLITLKAVECMRAADVIVYDRLVNPVLLKYAGSNVEKIYAGKVPDGHVLKQKEINSILVDRAKQGKVVARLKGGDPFIFGRGGEEAEELAAAGVPFEIVPGVTSAVAVPAYAGIPLTHRDHTSTVAFVTGNEDPDKAESAVDWEKIGTGAGTLVFLMGMANLPKIVAKLLANGRKPTTPVAVIRWGTRPEQYTVEGCLGDIVEKVRAEKITNPAVIIVGSVCRLRATLKWFEQKPLFGKRVLVTRAREQASVLTEAIERLGGEALEFPTIAIAPPLDWGPLDAAIAAVTSFDWLIFTSVNGVKYFFKRLRETGKDLRDMGPAKICAIGPKTRQVLESSGLRVDYVPTEYRADKIAEGLKDHVGHGTKILMARADIAPKSLAQALEGLGASVTDVTAYRTVPVADNAALIREWLAQGRIQVVTFTSSSTVQNFVKAMDVYDPAALLSETLVACIGPVTATTARQLGLRVDIQPKEYTIEGLVDAIVGYFAKERK